MCISLRIFPADEETEHGATNSAAKRHLASEGSSVILSGFPFCNPLNLFALLWPPCCKYKRRFVIGPLK